MSMGSPNEFCFDAIMKMFHLSHLFSYIVGEMITDSFLHTRIQPFTMLVEHYIW